MSEETVGFTISKSYEFARCARCNRRLSNPVSVSLGIGPICRGRVNGGAMAPHGGEEERQVHLAIPLEQGLVFKRLSESRIATNVPWLVAQHSGTGFEWGYGGSGPADLALNIVEAILRRTDFKQRGRKRKAAIKGTYFTASWRLHQKLKWAFVAPIPKEGTVIPYEEVYRWIEESLLEV